MRHTSDLVRDSKLPTAVRGDITRHVIEASGRDRRHRRVRREQRWQRLETLGHGTFGIVWKEKLIAGESDVNERAVKMIRKTLGKTTVDYTRELEAIAKFSRSKYNPYFVQSYGWYESQDAVFITMEFFESGDLQEYMSEVTRMPEEDVQQVAYQILEGLKHMHENDFAHRDLKPSNILVRRTKSKDEDWWVKIGDFGISKRAEEGMTALRTFSGTVGFLAPEVLVQNGYLDAPILANKRGYTLAVDIWSLGEIIYRAICGGSPFVTGLAAYANLKTEFPLAKLRELDISEEGIDLIQKLMKAQPDERLTATQALEHAWFKEIREDSPRSSGESLRLGSIQSSLLSPDFGHGSSGDSSFDMTEASAQWSTIDGTTTLSPVEKLGQTYRPTESEAEASSSQNVLNNDGKIDDNTIIPPTIKATGIPPPTSDLGLLTLSSGLNQNLVNSRPTPVEYDDITPKNDPNEQPKIQYTSSEAARKAGWVPPPHPLSRHAPVEQDDITPKNDPNEKPKIQYTSDKAARKAGWVPPSSPAPELGTPLKRTRLVKARDSVEWKKEPSEASASQSRDEELAARPFPFEEENGPKDYSRSRSSSLDAESDAEPREQYRRTEWPGRRRESSSPRSRARYEKELRELQEPRRRRSSRIKSDKKDTKTSRSRGRSAIRSGKVNPFDDDDNKANTVRNKGKGRVDISNIFEALDKAQTSPAGPPSVRKRQSITALDRLLQLEDSQRDAALHLERLTANWQAQGPRSPQQVIPPSPIRTGFDPSSMVGDESQAPHFSYQVVRHREPGSESRPPVSIPTSTKATVRSRPHRFDPSKPGSDEGQAPYSPSVARPHQFIIETRLDHDRKPNTYKSSTQAQNRPKTNIVIQPASSSERRKRTSKNAHSRDSESNPEIDIYSDSDSETERVRRHRGRRKRSDRDDDSVFLHNSKDPVESISHIQMASSSLPSPAQRGRPLPDRGDIHVRTRSSRTSRPRSRSVSSYSSYESPPRRHPPSSSKTSRTGRFLSQAAGAATAAGSVFALMGMKKKHDDEIARGERQARERNNYYSESEPESVQPAKHTSRSNKLTRRPNPEDSSKGTTTYSYV